jgi:PadR family transcriptional regulator PadR
MPEYIEKELNLIELENKSKFDGISELDDEEYIKFIERTVKANREIFVLQALADEPMCGYDVIKEIFMKCNVFLSQGIVYPILYSLEEDGIIRAEYTKGNMRSKLYFITAEGRETVQKRIDIFVKAMKAVLFLVG